jgi:lipopolysaccharide export system protein LptA
MASTRARRAAGARLHATLAAALVAVLGAVATPGAPARAAAPQLQPNVPINLDARSSDFDYKNGTLVFQGVRIAQGPLSVEADEAVATGLEFDDSRWTFRGNVKITTADGSLTSNEARVQFADNQIKDALITGAPAAFQQQRENGIARGRASRIEYDFAAGTVRLTDGAWLTDGVNEINGRTLVYSMKDRRVLATASEQSSQRVRITINPQQKKPAPGAAPDAPAATPAPPSEPPAKPEP